MKILLDTSVLIDVERRSQEAIRLLGELSVNNEELVVSTITISELLAGPYLIGQEKALAAAKKLLNQFVPVDLCSLIAEKIAQYMAYLAAQGTPLEFQDIAIAATCTITRSDFLLTQNKKHFEILPDIGNKAKTIAEFSNIYR